MLQKTVLFVLVSMFLTSTLFGMQKHVVILQYHRFDENKYPTTSISMKLFTQQMEYLTQHHYNIWPLSKVVRYLQQKKPLPDKTVVISIDDAYRSTYTKAYPLLKKYHLPFTLFVSTLPVDHGSKNYLTWDMMREMAKNGAEFANHTYSHQYLVRDRLKDPQDKQYIVDEIQKSQEKLEKELGNSVATKPKMLAYPFGEYDKNLMHITKELGYVGVAQNSGPISSESDFMALRRFPMSGGYGEMEQFVVKINTLPLPLLSVEDEDTIVDESNNPPLLTLSLQKPLKGFQCFNANGEKLKMQWMSDTQVTVQSSKPLAYPRDHYTCTAPTQNKESWYWYSHLWVVLQKQP
ncbi:polysaccharide deacetylase family protein [Sulfurimonas paralvinellae]|uniref:Polysaccharide deacetylase family protein n=1 Tax=Sulfurimonas paralvinellae TaxID=317658 RepID=A0A7M1B7M7_9BACT|nr:polysaccharide deacetylase family protein [Sulfurimonas paralvinellae]QOP45655.1 polysaccharide deacetylase family protein [Sulfurimonas paralvinellae]